MANEVKLCIGISHAEFSPKRRAMLTELIAMLGGLEKIQQLTVGMVVAKDWRRDVWDTCRRALLAPIQFPSATHLLYLQEDDIVCRDFIETVLLHASMKPKSVISYISWNGKINEAMADGKHWTWAPDHYTSAPLLMPADAAISAVVWADRNVPPSYRYDDGRIAMYLLSRQLREEGCNGVWNTAPCLAENGAPFQSVDNYPHSEKGHTAVKFIGKDKSGMDVDWEKGALHPVIEKSHTTMWGATGRLGIHHLIPPKAEIDAGASRSLQTDIRMSAMERLEVSTT